VPTLNDQILKQKKKPFEKKEYRTWLLEDFAQEQESKVEKAPSAKLALFSTEETEVKNGDKQRPNQSQTRVKPGPTEVKPESNQSRTKYILETEQETKLEPSWKHRRQDSCFTTLSGLQREIAIFLYFTSKSSRDKITDPIGIEYLALSCTTTKLSAKKAIQRMEKKGVLVRTSFKEGRGGWTRYEIVHSLFQEIMHAENSGTLNRGQTEVKLGTKLQTESRSNLPYSSSLLNKNNTTTEEGSDQYDTIDITSLTSRGFTHQHLNQVIQKSGLPHEMIQDSIDAISFDLRRNGLENKLKAKGINFLRYIMGILIKGPYNAPDNYESPKQEKIREYLEKKKAIQKRDEELLEEAMNLAFEKWSGSSENNELIQEIMKNIPPLVRKNESALRGTLRTYYRETIWPIEKEKLLEEIES